MNPMIVHKFKVIYVVLILTSIGNQAKGSGISITPDTLYILFEKETNNQVSKLRFKLETSSYPNDITRSFYINSKSDHFIHPAILPYNSNLENDYFLANKVFLNNRKIYDQKWFASASRETIYQVFGGQNTVIYLAEKSRFKDGYYTFIRVYFKPFVYE